MQRSLTLEENILLACTQPNRGEVKLLESWPAALDWQYICGQASRHGILPFLHRFLSTGSVPPAPVEILKLLDGQTRQLAIANLFQTRELLRVIDLLEAESIEVMPFKGPALGYYLYGNLALRTFGDLDLLIHRDDFKRVKKLLESNGYKTFRHLSAEEEKDFVDTQMGFEFVREDERCVIEVHWSFLNRVHAFNMKPAEVWLHKSSFSLNGHRVLTFSPAHLLVYLCAHGSKSFWSRLQWICDVAELVRKHQDASFWESTQQIARECHGTRMLYLGLYLAHTLLNAPVPLSVQKNIQKDPKVLQLSTRVIDTLFTFQKEDDLSLQNVSFHLAMRERFFDRLPYFKHLFKLWLKPSAKDRAFVKLPSGLHFMYVFVKPFRIVRDRLVR